MKVRIPRPLRRPLAFAVVVTVGLGGLPLLWARSASFLGKDVSTVAASIVGFYPGSAVAEAARILSVAFVYALVGCLPFVFGARGLRRGRWLVFPVLPLVAYAFWWLGAVVKYPALYEPFLPEAMQRFVFELAFRVSPKTLFVIAGLITALAPLLGLRARARTVAVKSRRTAAREAGAVAVLVVIVGSLAVSAARLSANATGESRRDAAKRPNILLIGIDSLRTDRLSRADVTPALQSLLADPQTVSLDDHYVGLPRTFPSWLEMIQGRYAARTGVRHMFPGFGARTHEFKGLVTSLRAAGYHTGAYSDFAGDIFPRFEGGFDEVVAPKLTLMTMIRLSLDQSFPAFLPLLTTGPARPLFPALKQSPAYGDPEHLGAELRARLVLGGERPWMKTVFFSTAHFPYAAPAPYYARFSRPDYAGPYRFEKNPEMGGAVTGIDDAEIAQARALYDGAVRAIDDELARLFADLRAKGLWDDTLIVVTADHGEDLYENGLLQGHGEHLRGENVLRVPLLMKLPTSLAPAQETAGGVPAAAPASTPRHLGFTSRVIDLAPTVLALVGVTPDTSFDGVDLSPWIRGTRVDAPALPAYAETEIWFSRGGPGFFQQKRLDYPGISGLLSFDQGYSGEIVLDPRYERMIITSKHRMLIDGDYKLIYMPTTRGVEYELYDRRKDPANLHDLAASDPARLAKLRSRLLSFVKEQEGADKVTIVDDFVVPR